MDFENWIERYSRQIILPEVGGEGQKKLNRAKILVIGIGGLGSPVAYYLAAAGIGTIGLVDSDKVELSNLNRQIIHSTDDIGKDKVLSAKEKLNNLNPDIEIISYKERLGKENIFKILDDYDFVIDGTDNFPTRYLINDSCVIKKKPLSSGAILGFESMITTFTQEEDSACYRCIFPIAPPPGTVPNCQEAGVFGVLPGVIGALQATEAIKYFLGLKDNLLKNKLLIYNAKTAEFSKLSINKDLNCVACGNKNITLNDFIYEDSCQLSMMERTNEKKGKDLGEIIFNLVKY